MHEQVLCKKLCTTLMLFLEQGSPMMRLVLNKSFLFFTYLKDIVNFFLFTTCTLQANLFGNYVCKCSFDMNYHASAHLMCHWKKEKTFFFGGLNMKENFQQLPI
jgi:hypothetical protein